LILLKDIPKIFVVLYLLATLKGISTHVCPIMAAHRRPATAVQPGPLLEHDADNLIPLLQTRLSANQGQRWTQSILHVHIKGQMVKMDFFGQVAP
jgi:hypothetical protein